VSYQYQITTNADILNQTPNFAMDPEDVPLARELPRGRAELEPPPRLSNRRWTMQYFSDEEHIHQLQQKFLFPHNTDLLVPQDLRDWPTDLIFDIHYGCVAFQRWCQKEAVETILKMYRDIDNEKPSPGPQLNELLNDCEQEGRGKSPQFMASSAGDMLDLVVMFRSMASQQEQKSMGLTQPTCMQDVQMKVLDWLKAC
jgi:hypothetical protein